MTNFDELLQTFTNFYELLRTFANFYSIYARAFSLFDWFQAQSVSRMSPSRQDRSWTACLLWCTPLPVEGATSLLYMLHRDSRYHCGGSKQILCVIRELPRVREAVASRPAFIRGIYSTGTAVGAFASQRTKGVQDVTTSRPAFIHPGYVYTYKYIQGLLSAPLRPSERVREAVQSRPAFVRGLYSTYRYCCRRLCVPAKGVREAVALGMCDSDC